MDVCNMPSIISVMYLRVDFMHTLNTFNVLKDKHVDEKMVVIFFNA